MKIAHNIWVTHCYKHLLSTTTMKYCKNKGGEIFLNYFEILFTAFLRPCNGDEIVRHWLWYRYKGIGMWLCVCATGGSRGALGPPLPPRFFVQNHAVFIQFLGKTLFWGHFRLRAPLRNSAGPLSKILDPPLCVFILISGCMCRGHWCPLWFVSANDGRTKDGSRMEKFWCGQKLLSTGN